MRVFITGSTGFVGRYIIQCLASAGYDLIPLIHSSGGISNDCFEAVHGDITDEAFDVKMFDSIDKCDVIIHAASDITVPESDKTIDVNIFGTRNVVRLAEKWNVSKLIYLSSVPVIGMPEVLPVTEDHSVHPATLYHMAKYIGEKLILNSHVSDRGLILRLPSPIGVGMNKNSFVFRILSKLSKNDPIEIYGSGKRIQNYLDVRDIAKCVLGSVNCNKSGVFLLGNERSYSNTEIYEICKNITGSTASAVYGRKDDPEESVRWILSCEKARKELGFQPEKDIKDSIRWVYEEMIHEADSIL